VCVDLKEGNAWWVTRLLAVCAGAIGVGSPRAIVFVGRRENRERIFLGWGAPINLLRAIVDSNPEYRSRLGIARAVTRQIALFGRNGSEFPFELNLDGLRGVLGVSATPVTPAATQGVTPAPTPKPTAIQVSPTAASLAWAYDENEYAMLA